MQLKSTECCLIVFYSLIDQEGSLTQNNNYVVETFEAFEKKKMSICDIFSSEKCPFSDQNVQKMLNYQNASF